MKKKKFSFKKYRDDSQLSRDKDFYLVSEDGRHRIFHFKERGGGSICETTILYSKDFSGMSLRSAYGDYEMDCDYCLGSDAGSSMGLQYEEAPDLSKFHLLEVVCDECGTKFLMKPVISVHYVPIYDSRDDGYEDLISRFKSVDVDFDLDLYLDD